MRILFVCHWPWWLELGGPRHFIELAQELKRQGHSVHRLSATEAHVRPRSPAIEILRPPFSRLIRKRVEEVASRYDVIDALEGDLPFSKAALDFEGVLVARSTGLSHAFKEFLDYAERRWPDQDTGHPLGQALRVWKQRREWPDFERSWHAADLVTLSNPDEFRFLEAVGAGDKAVAFPLGLTSGRRTDLAAAARGPAERLRRREAVFIGYWYPRKGSLDFGRIVREVRERVPDARFLFLGTWVPEEQVLHDLEVEAANWIRIVPRFHSADLPGLIAGSTVGAFPSYIEGFGFAVLEQLAAGLPTVAYDVAGPREMLRKIEPPLMVPRGDTLALAEKLAAVLTSTEDEFCKLSARCLVTAQRFRWDEIAREMVQAYTARLEGRPQY